MPPVACGTKLSPALGASNLRNRLYSTQEVDNVVNTLPTGQAQRRGISFRRHSEWMRVGMAEGERPIDEVWQDVLTQLGGDKSVTPMLYGFLGLVEPKGIAAGTFYLEVPNDFTASMLNQRMRVALLAALATLPTEVTNFYVVVNPELEQENLRPDISAPMEQPNEVETPATPQSVFETTQPERSSDTRLN